MSRKQTENEENAEEHGLVKGAEEYIPLLGTDDEHMIPCEAYQPPHGVPEEEED